MRCQRQILDVCWWVHVSNAEVLHRSGLSTIGDILRHRRLSLFGHVARLDPGVPAHDVLHLITKADWPAGEDRRVALATSGSTKFS